MRDLCEECKKRPYTQLCDFASGSGIVTSVNFKELTQTCDKKLCRECAVNLWADCDVCPEHAQHVRTKLCNL